MDKEKPRGLGGEPRARQVLENKDLSGQKINEKNFMLLETVTHWFLLHHEDKKNSCRALSAPAATRTHLACAHDITGQQDVVGT